MLDIIRYVQNKTNTFEEESFCEVDCLVFSWLAYLVFPTDIAEKTHKHGVKIKDLYRLEYFDTYFSMVQMPSETEWLFSLVAASPRYRDTPVFCYEDQLDSELDKQFSAMSFMLPDKKLLITFRGTDPRFTGWKEDLKLSLDRPVPAQIESRKYLEKIGYHFPEHKIIISGHSKGGNMAVYAASRCPRHIQDRILTVYSMDGPGFPSSSLIHEGLRLIYTRCCKLVPQGSIVGLMMDDDVEYDVIESCEKGFKQHIPLTWNIDGDHFVRLDNLRTEALIMERGLDNWLGEMSLSQRSKFINTVFEILEETGAEDFNTLGENLKLYLPAILKKLEHMERKDRLFLLFSFKKLAESEVKSIPAVLRDIGRQKEFKLLF